MNSYEPKNIEGKWVAEWEKLDLARAIDGDSRPKYYCLVEFPFPSGDGLHTGHIKGYTAMDIVSRKRRMQGYNVLFPIGWDAFGLPTENYAIKTKTHPKVVTKKNTDIFRKQLKSVGFSFDWSREINTTDPNYYKWTQWIFIQFFKKGLAYKKHALINWCPSCKIGLANEEVIDGKCERCGTPVEKKEKDQWMLAITKYAQRLYDDLDKTQFPDRVKILQRNWIGPSTGTELTFKLKDRREEIKVFTTRIDTLFGVTYLVLAPDHPIVPVLAVDASNTKEINDYIQISRLKPDQERTAEDREKTGVELIGIKAINPANGEEVPVWIADYVLADYGTGAVMAVPAHDERDYAFAKKYNLPIKEVIKGAEDNPPPFCGYGKLINSEQFTGLTSEEAKEKISEFVGGKIITTFKLRDWVFSRQHYWGEPIPMIKCPKCGWVPVPEKDLPVTLPNVENYLPTDNGESPLSMITEWVNTTCPTCGGPAKRETDTMPNWAGSSWYYLRYMDPENDNQLASQEKLKYWGQVDWYNGGAEHITLHLLYSRFWHKFLFDLGVVPYDEPYLRRSITGIVLGEGGVKMSKSKGNVVNPDAVIQTYGADTLRLYEMFMGPFDQAIAWDTKSIIGVRRFLEKVWRLQSKVDHDATDINLEVLVNKTIKKVSEDIETMSFNTAISSMMILVNEMDKMKAVPADLYEKLLIILTPFAPFICEEIWHNLGHTRTINKEVWPSADESKMVASQIPLVLQVNGKVRDTIMVNANISEEEAKALALNNEVVKKWLNGATAKRVIYVPGRLVNVVV
jgi:leucyl-tRNA synthetase